MAYLISERAFRCDFCGDLHTEADMILVNINVCICDQCVRDCTQIVEKKTRETDWIKYKDLAP